MYMGNVEYNSDNMFLVIELHKNRETTIKKIYIKSTAEGKMLI